MQDTSLVWRLHSNPLSFGFDSPLIRLSCAAVGQSICPCTFAKSNAVPFRKRKNSLMINTTQEDPQGLHSAVTLTALLHHRGFKPSRMLRGLRRPPLVGVRSPTHVSGPFRPWPGGGFLFTPSGSPWKERLVVATVSRLSLRHDGNLANPLWRPPIPSNLGRQPCSKTFPWLMAP